VPEVEIEVRWHPKFRSQFEPQILRAVDTGSLTVLGPAEVRKVLVSRGIPAAAIESQMRALAQRCEEYEIHVGQGEAYTHANAVTLTLPAMSNDGAAVRQLLAEGKLVSCPTLRFFDLLVFARTVGWISDDAGESARSYLDGAHEYLPPQFKNKNSFASQWAGFACRLSTDPALVDRPALTATSTLHVGFA
jgi:hypothetical protein